MEICSNIDCTGCLACMNVCPKNAIICIEDELGKTVPEIDDKKCIKCGLCKKTCPSNNDIKFNRADKAYAAWSLSKKDRKFSSSGGMASVFSEKVISENGTVYGCASISGEVRHIGIDDSNDIDLLRGSKYVQSDVGVIYREIKEKLKKEKKVIFFGTPCQVSGLRSYLGKEYENLITVDLICHGTPPMKYLNEHIEKAVKGKKFDSFAFRGKYDYCLAVYSGNKKLYKEYKDNDEYFTAFLKSMILRNNCYKCKYARPERVSDITIGDFWGINRDTLKNKYEGRISLVMPNTEKGDVFFKSCKDMLVCEVRKIDEALNPAQGNLLHPSVPHIKREVFIQNYPKYGFEKAIYMTGIGEEVRKKRIKHKVTRPIRLIKKISAKIKRKI